MCVPLSPPPFNRSGSILVSRCLTAMTSASVNDARGIITDPLLQQNAGFTGINASLSFSQSSQDHTFGAAAGSGLRYYSSAPSVLPVNYYGGLNFSTRLGRRLQVRGSEYASMSPFYAFRQHLHVNRPAADPRRRRSTRASSSSTRSRLIRPPGCPGRSAGGDRSTPDIR